MKASVGWGGARVKRNEERASRAEIFAQLERLTSPQAVVVVNDVAKMLQEGEADQAMEQLQTFDAAIGGIGLHSATPKRKLPGVYRPITYVDLLLRNRDRQEFARSIIIATGGHIESILKRMARLNLFERLRAGLDRLPM